MTDWLNDKTPSIVQHVIPAVPQSHGALSSQWEPQFHLPSIQAPTHVENGWNMLNDRTMAQQVIPAVPQSHGALSSQWEPPFHLPSIQVPNLPRIDSYAKPVEAGPLFYSSLSQDYWTRIPVIPGRMRRRRAQEGGTPAAEPSRGAVAGAAPVFLQKLWAILADESNRSVLS
jgi:hypothetical protein